MDICEYFRMRKSRTYLTDETKYNKVWVSIIGNEEGITMWQRLKREEVIISNYKPTNLRNFNINKKFLKWSRSHKKLEKYINHIEKFKIPQIKTGLYGLIEIFGIQKLGILTLTSFQRIKNEGTLSNNFYETSVTLKVKFLIKAIGKRKKLLASLRDTDIIF